MLSDFCPEVQQWTVSRKLSRNERKTHGRAFVETRKSLSGSTCPLFQPPRISLQQGVVTFVPVRRKDIHGGGHYQAIGKKQGATPRLLYNQRLTIRGGGCRGPRHPLYSCVCAISKYSMPFPLGRVWHLQPQSPPTLRLHTSRRNHYYKKPI